jgi:hypothetical protein
MDDANIRDHLALQITKFGAPHQSNAAIPHAEWKVQFGQAWFLVDIEHALNSLNIGPPNRALIATGNPVKYLYCLSCLKVIEHRRVMAYRMYIIYEEDPLKNVPCFIHMSCHNCEFDMLANSSVDLLRPQQTDMFSDPNSQQWAQQQQQRYVDATRQMQNQVSNQRLSNVNQAAQSLGIAPNPAPADSSFLAKLLGPHK